MNSIYEMCRCILIRACLLIPLSFATGSVLAQGGQSVCEKPTELGVADVSENTAVLLWVGTGSESDFEIEVRSKGRTPKLKRITRSMESSVMMEGLVPGSDYKFRVRSRCSGSAYSGSTKWSSFQTAGMSPEESCPKASNLVIANATLTTAALSWSGSDYAAHYEVEVRSKGNTPTYFFEKSLSDTSVTIFGLSPMSKYQFRVRTTCENTAVSGSTAWETFVPGEDTGPDTCDIVSDLVVDSISDHSAIILWSSTDGNTVFALTVSDSMGFDTTFAPAANPTLIEGLMPDTDYYLSLQVNCTSGIPKTLMATFSTRAEIEDTCEIPDGLIAQDIDSLGFELSWNPTGDVTSYQVQINDLDTTNVALVDTIVADPMFQFAKIDTIEGYVFRVRALCSSTSMSEYSAWIPFPPVSDSTVLLVCDSPANLMIDSAKGNNAFLSWTGPADALFQIQVKTADTLWSFVLDASDTMATLILSDLDPFTDYEVRVRSLCSNRERSDYTEWTAFTTMQELALCLAPADLSAARLDDSTAILSWTSIDSAISYIVGVEVVDTGSTALQIGSEDTSVEFSGLMQGIDYHFRVQSICALGDTTDFSDWVAFNLNDTLPEPCEVASDLVVDTITSNSVMLSWTGPEASSFLLFVNDLDTIGQTLEYPTMDPFIYLDSLTPETEYEVYIQTVCGDEISEFSEIISFVTLALEVVDTSACDAPNNFRLDSVDATNAWISWDAPDSLLYLVKVGSVDSSLGFIYAETVGETRIHLEGLLSNENYSVQTKTLCSNGDTSLNSDVFIFQTLDAPTEPMDSCQVPIGEILEVNEESVEVSWTTSSENAFYLLEVENIGLTPHFNLVTTSRDTIYLIDGLVSGGVYQWKVAGFCDGGTYSDSSPWMIFETPGEQENSCSPPTDLQALILGDGIALLSWAESSEDLDYEVEVESLDTTPFYEQNSIVLEAQLNVEGLAPSGAYQFKVNVQCSDGTISEDSDWVTFINDISADTVMMASALTNHEQMAFPNPARTIMTVKVPEILADGEAIVELSDMMGRTVMSDKNPRVAKADFMQFNVGNLREGIYKLSVRSSQGQFHELVFVRK